ncbi:MAG: YIP1 family protein [Acidobacteriota bacterium]
MGRILGVLTRPRATMAAVVAEPSWVWVWLGCLATWAVLAASLLSTAVGRQALVDERVRVVEAFGGTVDDAAYAALQAAPPVAAYLGGGGRLLLNPAVTLLVAAGLWVLARADGTRARPAQALAVAVHASVVLVVGQIVATPLHYLRESLTSPTNLAVLVPALDEGSLAARFLGTIDVFGLWWTGLLAIGMAALTGRPARRYLVRLVGVYVAVAAVMATALAVAGG